MDLMVGFSAVSQALNIAKQLKEFEKQFDSAEFKLKLADLYSTLADAKIALADAKELIDAKDAEITALKKNFQLRSEGVRHNGLLYDKSPSGDPAGHPYCPRCEEIDGVRIKLTYDEGARGNEICPECKAKYRHVTAFHSI
jgi:hypothetical protein